jgi:DNA invertase Pin-like site-specific DNA recombinase
VRQERHLLIGYARTSTIEQVNGLDAQIDQLNALGCEKIFSEQVSSISKRPELMKSVDFCREGDIFVATKLDRLARSVQDVWKLVEDLDRKDVHLRGLDIGIDTSAPTGRLILTVLGGISQFEREIMLERQREGIARAKTAEKYKGRKPTAKQKTRDVLVLRQEGLGATEIAREVGIGRASVYRILSAHRQEFRSGNLNMLSTVP